jgi:monoterpene epsilon-lactone hydrolase
VPAPRFCIYTAAGSTGGSAKAYRNFVGHIAASVCTAAFIPDYRLAPEHPFPAGPKDAQAAYDGLVDRGIKRVAVVGDSAGGALALGLRPRVKPVGIVALSPVTDLSQSGPSWETRDAFDIYFTRAQAAALIANYLGDEDPANPVASPLFSNLAGLPPIRVHVGEDELLLDDSIRFVERAAAAGVDATVDVWQGMLHVFPASVDRLQAASAALDAIGAFLDERFTIATEVATS